MKTITEKNLETLKIPEPDTKQHQAQLKNALLSSSHWYKKTNFFDFFEKGGEEITVMKRFLNLGIIALVLIVAALFVLFSPMHTNTQRAYAEQLAQDSSQAVAQLTPSELQKLKQRLPLGPDVLLQEAKNAKDLQTLTYEQFVNEYPQIKRTVSTNTQPQGQIIKRQDNGDVIYAQSPTGALPSKFFGMPEFLDMHKLKFLQFTDTNGSKIVLGIDQNNLPVFVYGQGKDGNTFGAVRVSGTPPINNDQQMVVSLNDNGNSPFILINGKKYSVPASVTIVPGSQPPSIQVKDGNVYVNGIKATPVQ